MEEPKGFISWISIVADPRTIGMATYPLGEILLTELALLALPHAVGAPPVIGAGSAPEDLARSFALASLAAAGFFWVMLGLVSGLVYGRLRQS